MFMFIKIIKYIKDWYIYFRDFDKNYWYDFETNEYWPKCHLCKGKRNKKCPKTCLGNL